MNREILFRGKRVDNGEFIEGCYFKRWTGARYKHYIIDWLIEYEVVPETVGQFTGICDKNGKEIFEGDIVKLCDTNPVMFKVEIKLAKYGYKTVFIDIDNGKVAENYFLDKCEVVGNIFNPELLEVEK
jgi:uncharacterized phage protein (TIGR01671 family)